jgi:hypothetical protein
MKVTYYEKSSRIQPTPYPPRRPLKTALTTGIHENFAFFNVRQQAHLKRFTNQAEKVFSRHSGDYFSLVLVIETSGKDS